MKKKTTDAVVLLCLVLVIILDWNAYYLVHNPTLIVDKHFLFYFCGLFTTGIALINFMYFDVISLRISYKRIKYAARCFASYFTKKALKDTGNPIMSFLSACKASHYFFLKTFKV